MQVLCVLVTLLPFALCAFDPTTICYPSQLEFNVLFFDWKKSSYSHFAVDFSLGLMGGGNGDYKLVRDTKHATDYMSIRNADGSMSCTSSPMDPNDAYPQCLPANAKNVTTDSITFSEYGVKLDMEFFDYNYNNQNNGNITKVGLQMVGGLVYPSYLIDPRTPNSLYSYDNVTIGVSNPQIFQVPNNCPPKALVVG